MFRTTAIALTLSLAGIATAASAEEIILTQPIAGASLHAGGVDMAVYYQDVDSGMEVSGYYAPLGSEEVPGRVQLLLQDGETATFSLPNTARVVYSFARDGETLSVTATPPWIRVAQR